MAARRCRCRCSTPPPRCGSDEEHVEPNRALYRRKFDVAEQTLGRRFGFYRPPGGFFLWLDVGDGEQAAKALWREAGVRTLPGAYVARADRRREPGQTLHPRGARP